MICRDFFNNMVLHFITDEFRIDKFSFMIKNDTSIIRNKTDYRNGKNLILCIYDTEFPDNIHTLHFNDDTDNVSNMWFECIVYNFIIYIKNNIRTVKLNEFLNDC